VRLAQRIRIRMHIDELPLDRAAVRAVNRMLQRAKVHTQTVRARLYFS
jgi:hypothetical protein